MLRITAKTSKDKKVLILEGKICQEWVRELREEIEKGIRQGKKVILDFARVAFLDEEAAKMINQFPPQEVEKSNGSLFIQAMLKTEEREGR